MKFQQLGCLLFATLFLCGCGAKQAQLEKYVAEEKKNLPKQLFDGGKVIDIEARESELVYTCESRNVPTAKLEAAKNKLQQDAENYVRQNKSGLQRLVDNKIKMTFVAQNKNQKELFRFTIHPWEL